MTERSRFEPRRRARRRALQALYQWHLNPQDAGTIIDQFLEEQDFANVDVAFFQAVVTGVTRSHEALLEQVSGHLDRPWSQLDVTERVILQIGAWELLNQPGIPHQVILDEAIELARRFGAEQGHSFVNGVLDPLARRLRAIPDEAPSDRG